MNGAPQRAKIQWPFHSQAGKRARPQNLQRSNHLCLGQPQIERGDDHANLETAILQQNVIHGKRQQGDQKIALGKPHAQQLPRQRRGEAVELAPGDRAVALRAQNRGSIRAGLGPPRHHAVKKMAIGKGLFVIVEGKLRHAHRLAHSCF